MWSQKFLGPKGKVTDYSNESSTVEDTGRIVENVGGLKPLGAKGKIKIELTDVDTGELVDSSETNNFIAKGMDYLYQMQMKNLFQRGKYTGKFNTNPLADVFQRMRLTDADHDEDPENEWVMHGKIIGEARTDNNSMIAEPLGGQYNDVESFTNENMVRIVVDFPAASANGEINSVYFHGTDTLFNSEGDTKQHLKVANSNNEMKLVYYNSRYYGAFHSYGSNGHKMDIMDEDFNVITTHNSGLVSNVEVYNGRLYFAGGNGGSNHLTIWSIDINQIDESASDIKLYDLDSRVIHAQIPTGTRDTVHASGSGITYDPEKRLFYVVYYSVNAAAQQITTLDADFNVLDSHDVIGATGGNIPNVLTYRYGLLYYAHNTIDPNTGTMVPLAYNNNSIVGFDKDGWPIRRAMSTSRSGNYIYPKIEFSSRAKLSSPVNKTASHNMKVTYDFVLPSIYGETQ